jgi:hypothetical protein
VNTNLHDEMGRMHSFCRWPVFEHGTPCAKGGMNAGTPALMSGGEVLRR